MPDEKLTIPCDDWFIIFRPQREVALIEVGGERELAVMFWSRRERAEQFLRENSAQGEVIHVFSRTRLRTHPPFAGLVQGWLQLGIKKAVVDLRRFEEPDVLVISLPKFFELRSPNAASLAPSQN
jgi:hypothetical protein